MFANRLLSDEKMPPKPFLESHTLTHFLDKFVYRNAKATAGAPRGGSIMQPLSGGDSRGILLSGRATQIRQEPVNTEAFWRKKAEDVSVDEVFFHKYFNQIGKGKEASNKKKAAPKVGEASENEDDENEDEIWQALVDSRPEVEGPSDDDSDLEMDDLEDSDVASISEVDVEGDGDEGAEVAGSEVSEIRGLFDDDDAELGSDEDAPSDMDELFEKELQRAQKSGEKTEETSRQKKRMLKNLPTFASMEDYAEMLDNDDDEDL
jgi:ribosome biogenesis protein MAK21